MSHVDEGRLHAYLDGAFLEGDPERTEIDRHLAGCAECRAGLEEARRLRTRASGVLGHMDPGPVAAVPFETIVARRTAGAGDVTGGRRRGMRAGTGGRSRRYVPVAWAASILVAVTAGWFARGQLAVPTALQVPPVGPRVEVAPAPEVEPAESVDVAARRRDVPERPARREEVAERLSARDRAARVVPEAGDPERAPRAPVFSAETRPRVDHATKMRMESAPGAAAPGAADIGFGALAGAPAEGWLLLAPPAGTADVPLAQWTERSRHASADACERERRAEQWGGYRSRCVPTAHLRGRGGGEVHGWVALQGGFGASPATPFRAYDALVACEQDSERFAAFLRENPTIDATGPGRCVPARHAYPPSAAR